MPYTTPTQLHIRAWEAPAVTVLQILTRLHAYGKKVNRVPKVREREIASLFKEVQRKIGSSRKALYIAGVLPEARKRNYPRLSFAFKDGRYQPSARSLRQFKTLCSSDPAVKERIK